MNHRQLNSRPALKCTELRRTCGLLASGDGEMDEELGSLFETLRSPFVWGNRMNEPKVDERLQEAREKRKSWRIRL